jgi:hypothetical protein
MVTEVGAGGGDIGHAVRHRDSKGVEGVHVAHAAVLLLASGTGVGCVGSGKVVVCVRGGVVELVYAVFTSTDAQAVVGGGVGIGVGFKAPLAVDRTVHEAVGHAVGTIGEAVGMVGEAVGTVGEAVGQAVI